MLRTLLAFLAVLPAAVTAAQPSVWKGATSTTSYLPGRPFGIVATPDGRWVFESVMRGKNSGGIVVLERGGDAGRPKLHVVRTVTVPGQPTDLVLTHDQHLLLASAIDDVDILDVAMLESGKGEPVVAHWSDGTRCESINLNVSPDDRTLFVSEEARGTITVLNLAKIRASGFTPAAYLGQIPTGRSPIALVFSPDTRWLYTTCEVADPHWNWPKTAPRDGGRPGHVAEGAVVVIDMARVLTDPAASVVSRVPAGGSAVRAALSPGGNILYVTVRSANQLVAFDTTKLVTDSAHARLGSVRVGSAPVPLILIDHGRAILVGNSNRFAGPSARSTLTVVDAAHFATGAAAVLGSIPCGGFPRAFAASPDGSAVYLSNFGSNTVQTIALR